MLALVSIVILVAMIKIAIMTDRPVICAAVYTGIRCLFALGLGGSWPHVLIFGTIAFVLAWVYFWLLCKTQETVWFWVVAIVGALIGLV